MSERYQVSSAPHVRDNDSTGKIMLYVVLALLPASLFGIYNFGWKALLLILITVASSVLFETLFNKITHRRNTISDLSAVVTGLLLALNLPVSLPWWEAVIGAAFAIIIVKMLFGGLGQNFMNPALGGRCFFIDCICCGYDELQGDKRWSGGVFTADPPCTDSYGRLVLCESDGHVGR